MLLERLDTLINVLDLQAILLLKVLGHVFLELLLLGQTLSFDLAHLQFLLKLGKLFEFVLSLVDLVADLFGPG